MRKTRILLHALSAGVPLREAVTLLGVTQLDEARLEPPCIQLALRHVSEQPPAVSQRVAQFSLLALKTRSASSKKPAVSFYAVSTSVLFLTIAFVLEFSVYPALEGGFPPNAPTYLIVSQVLGIGALVWALIQVSQQHGFIFRRFGINLQGRIELLRWLSVCAEAKLEPEPFLKTFRPASHHLRARRLWRVALTSSSALEAVRTWSQSQPLFIQQCATQLPHESESEVLARVADVAEATRSVVPSGEMGAAAGVFVLVALAAGLQAWLLFSAVSQLGLGVMP